jgi:hypothetical protein
MLIAVGVVFLIGGLSKALRPSEFRSAIRGYRLLTRPAAVYAAAIVATGFEIVTGVWLVSGGRSVVLAAYAAALALCFFSGVVALALVKRIRTKCGCILVGAGEMIGWHVCLRNLALTSLLTPTLFHWPGMIMAMAAVFFLGLSMMVASWSGVQVGGVAEDPSTPQVV